MAERRMLAKRISTDARVRALPSATARLLFTWMIPHADNGGRLRAEPAYVRALVMPHEPNVSDADVASWLAEMDSLGIIQLYEVDGGQYLRFPAWSKYQRLDRNRSDLPPPPSAAPSSPTATDREPMVTDREPLPTSRERWGAGGGVGGRVGGRSGREKEVEFEREGEKPQSGPEIASTGLRPARTELGGRDAHRRDCVCEECMPTPGAELPRWGQ